MLIGVIVCYLHHILASIYRFNPLFVQTHKWGYCTDGILLSFLFYDDHWILIENKIPFDRSWWNAHQPQRGIQSGRLRHLQDRYSTLRWKLWSACVLCNIPNTRIRTAQREREIVVEYFLRTSNIVSEQHCCYFPSTGWTSRAMWQFGEFLYLEIFLAFWIEPPNRPPRNTS